jgi:serine/threonine-protein kinase
MGNRAQLYAYQRRFDDAVAQMQAVLAHDPDEFAAVMLGFYQEWAGHKDEAAATFTRPIKANASATVRMDSSTSNRTRVRYLALAYAGLWRKAEAVDVAQRAIVAYSGELGLKGFEELTLAMVQARFGEADNAISILERLLQAPHEELTRGTLRVDPMWDPIRNDPRFQKLCEDKRR